MEVSEFQHALYRGLGRAILHLQKHDSTPYRDVILHACLKNTTYDRQVEGGKSVYMMDIINLTGEKEYYRQQILDAATKIDTLDSYDMQHILDMVQAFAHEGNKAAREIIYNYFIKHSNEDSSEGAYRIVELDGFDGFLFVVEKLAQQPSFLTSLSDESLLFALEEQLGKSVMDDKLAEVRSTNPNVNSYLDWVESQQTKRQLKTAKRSIQKDSLAYSDIKQRIEKSINLNYRGWGMNTDEESLNQAANDLLDVLKQDDIVKLRRYLGIFWRRAFPLDPTPIIKLVDYQEEETYYPPLPVSALNVLSQVIHPSVREVALKLIAENRFTGRAVKLLNRNFELGDWQRTAEITTRKLDEEDYHSLEMSVRDIFKEHPSKDAAQTLLNLYEYGVCSFCRTFIVEALHSIDALADFIREECLYDSQEDIRELAQRSFEPKAK